VRGVLLLSGAAAFVALGVYLAWAIPKYTRMISNIFLSLVYSPPVETTPAGEGERLTILDSSEKEIEILVIQKKSPRKVAIFCHESGSSKESWEKYAYFLPDLGYAVVSADLKPATSAGDGKNALIQWPTQADVERLVTVIRWSKRAFRPGVSIVLFGVSNGADIAFAASFRDDAVKAVVADGLFSMKEIFRDYIRRWAPVLVRPNFFGEKFPEWIVKSFTELGFRYSEKQAKCRFVDVEKLLARKHVPLLMIHGAKDDVIPDGHRRFLGRLARERAVRKVVVEEAGHNQGVVTARAFYEAAVREFLESAS